MRAYLLLVAALGLLSLVACGSEPAEPVVAAAPPPDKARIYVYRDATYYGSQVWTAVSLNQMKIGDAAPGTVFYRDVAPGTYEIEVRSYRLYPDQFKTERLAPGSVTFVNIEEAVGWDNNGFKPRGGPTFLVVIVDPALAATQMRSLRLVPG